MFGQWGKRALPSLLPTAAASPAGYDLAINIYSGIKNPKEKFSLLVQRTLATQTKRLSLSLLLCMYMLLLRSVLMIDLALYLCPGSNSLLPV